jgi:hypothetical protein
MAKTLSMKWAVIISVLNVVISTIIWYFGQEASARPDLSSDSTFFAVGMAAVFVGACGPGTHCERRAQAVKLRAAHRNGGTHFQRHVARV